MDSRDYSQQQSTPNWDPYWNWAPPASTVAARPIPAIPLLDPEGLARVIGVQRIIGYLEDGTPITQQTRVDIRDLPSGAVVRVLITDFIVPIYHYGILVKTNGSLTVIHNTKDQGVRETSLDEFISSAERIEVGPTPSSPEHQCAILTRARANRGLQWRWSANCEDFVNFCYTGQKGSEQRNRFYVACGAAFVLGLAVANKQK